MGRVLKRDTPNDTPAVRLVRDPLALTRGMETLEALYQAWAELRLERAAVFSLLAAERARVAYQGSFLVGAVRVAAGTPEPPPEERALVQQGLDGILKEAEAKLAGAREELEKRAGEEAAGFERAFQTLREQIAERARRYLEKSRPRLELLLRPAGAVRTILHVARVAGDAAVLLLYLLSGKIPSRYDFLFDDSTEDLALPPASLYADEGVTPAETRPDGQRLLERILAKGDVLPAKGFLPVLVPKPEGGQDFFRLIQRGPVMEAELWDGQAFRSVLSREEGERFAGQLLRFKLEGKIELELPPG
jgi:hypothetical protein